MARIDQALLLRDRSSNPDAQKIVLSSFTSAPLSDALAGHPPLAVLEALPRLQPWALAGVTIGERLIVMDLLGPGEALATVRAVTMNGAPESAQVVGVDLMDAMGVPQRV